MAFEARDLPTAIWLREEVIVGPFCRHCGWPLTMHSDELLCRRLPFPLLPPICTCHALQRVERTVMVQGPGKRRRSQAIDRLEIVRVR